MITILVYRYTKCKQFTLEKIMHIIIHHSIIHYNFLTMHLPKRFYLLILFFFFKYIIYILRLNSCIITKFWKDNVYIYILVAPIFTGGCYLDIKISISLVKLIIKSLRNK